MPRCQRMQASGEELELHGANAKQGANLQKTQRQNAMASGDSDDSLTLSTGCNFSGSEAMMQYRKIWWQTLTYTQAIKLTSKS